MNSVEKVMDFAFNVPRLERRIMQITRKRMTREKFIKQFDRRLCMALPKFELSPEDFKKQGNKFYIMSKRFGYNLVKMPKRINPEYE
jgi:hypothetical protein